MRRARLHRRRVLTVRLQLDADVLVCAIPDCIEAGGFHFAFEDDVARRLGVDLRLGQCVGRADKSEFGFESLANGLRLAGLLQLG